MKRPLAVWMLILVLILLALGGFSGAWGFLSDLSGVGMGMESFLDELPTPDYTLPGILLLLLMFVTPLVLIYGLLRRPDWPWTLFHSCAGAVRTGRGQGH